MEKIEAKVDERGRIVIPAAIRKKMGIKPLSRDPNKKRAPTGVFSRDGEEVEGHHHEHAKKRRATSTRGIRSDLALTSIN